MNFIEQCTIESIIARLAAERDMLNAENEDVKNALKKNLERKREAERSF